MTVLLDAVDTSRRTWQHALLIAGIVLLAVSYVAFNLERDEIRSVAGWLTLLLGVVLMTAAIRLKVRFAATHAGHRIVVENDPVQGERLYVDGALAAKGKVGRLVTMQTALPSGHRVVVNTDARFLRFGCRIEVEEAP